MAVSRSLLLALLLLVPPALAADERLDPALARPFESTALHSEYSETLSEAERLAGLALVWSEVKYNFANFDLSPKELDWDARYLEFIPRVRAAQTTRDYTRELQRFVAALEDGHTRIHWPRPLWESMASPPIHTQLLGSRVVITLVDSRRLLEEGLAIGQEITHVDNLPVHDYAAEQILPFVAASTPQEREVRAFNFELLQGDRQTPVRITVVDETGAAREHLLPRSGYPDDDRIVPRPEPFSWRWAAPGVALLDIRTFNDQAVLDEFRRALPELLKADAWIFDIRLNGGGSSNIGFGILDALTDAAYPVFAWRTRIYRPTFRAWKLDEAWAWHDAGARTRTPAEGPKFAGKIALLTSPRTYSAAEDFTIAFRQLARGPILGQTTGGSTGQPLVQKLPGGGRFQICTKRDTAGDGTEWVGIGIPPDIEVAPTLETLRAGRDPVIERALAELRR